MITIEKEELNCKILLWNSTGHLHNKSTHHEIENFRKMGKIILNKLYQAQKLFKKYFKDDFSNNMNFLFLFYFERSNFFFMIMNLNMSLFTPSALEIELLKGCKAPFFEVGCCWKIFGKIIFSYYGMSSKYKYKFCFNLVHFQNCLVSIH